MSHNKLELTVRLLLVEERVVSSFNALRAVILMSKTGMAGGKQKIFEDSELEALLA